MKRLIAQLLTITLLLLPVVAYSEPSNFRVAKVELRNKVYFDQNNNGALGTAYCGCNWRWVGESGGRTDLESCGYQIRSPQSAAAVSRAERIEWEHVVTAHTLGKQRQCWKNGGRKNCNATDSVFNAMEANMHNLVPIIGEVNADRSNYNLGMVSGSGGMYGQCASKTDFKQRVFEPRNEAKGMTARIHFYMADRYDLTLSKQQQQLFLAWSNKYPPSSWEIERDKRIATVMGHNNPFVTGQRTWTLGHRNSGDGIKNTTPVQARQSRYANSNTSNTSAQKANIASNIKGNTNSKIYHVKNSCPNFNDVSERNSVYFQSEQEAASKGFRKARNCK